MSFWTDVPGFIVSTPVLSARDIEIAAAAAVESKRVAASKVKKDVVEQVTGWTKRSGAYVTKGGTKVAPWVIWLSVGGAGLLLLRKK